MVILDEYGAMIPEGNVDFDVGQIIEKSMIVYHNYVIDVSEEGHYEVIKEYPETGGKIVDWIVDTEERGHWETRNSAGDIVEYFDGVIPEDWPKEQVIEDVWFYYLYTPYTDEELAEIEKRKAEAEQQRILEERNNQFLESAPSRLGIVEESQQDVILALADVIGGE